LEQFDEIQACQGNFMQDQEITFDISDGVGTITLRRPEKLNALTQNMMMRLMQVLDEVEGNPEIRVVLLTATGRGFCVGADMTEIGARRKAADPLGSKKFIWDRLQKIALKMERLEKPVIAMVNGMARGAGADLALMCDIRIAAASASFSWGSYINIAIMAGNGGTYYLPRLVGVDRALELLCTGRVVDAEEAAQMRLVTRVVADVDASQVAVRMARLMAAQPANSVQFYRRAVYQGLGQNLYSHLDMISSHVAILGCTEESAGRVQAFRESRASSKKS